MSGIIGTSHSKSKVIGRSQDTAKAWVNFNGSSFTVRDSFNVASVTDNGTGHYTVNFNPAMPNINYSINITNTAVDGGVAGQVIEDNWSNTTGYATFTLGYSTGGGNGTAYDMDFVMVQVYGD